MSLDNKLRTSSKYGIPLTVLALVVGTPLLFGAGPAPTSRNLSVGDFAVLIAGRLQATQRTQTPLTPESAAAVLQKAGIEIRPELSAPATEGDAADVFRQIGISVEPQKVENLLERSKADSLISIFESALAAKAGIGPANPVTKGATAEQSGTAFPQATLAATIGECQSLPKTQDCQLCCRDLLSGGSQSDFHSNRICGKACNSKARNVSASEPTP